MWFCFVWKGSSFWWLSWVIVLFMSVAGDSGFGASRCCTVGVCGVVFPWCWSCWFWSWGHIFKDGLLFYKELFLVVCVLCNLKVMYQFLLLINRHCLECQEVDVVCEVRVIVFK